MRPCRNHVLATLLGVAMLTGAGRAADATPLVVNGGFEDTGATFVNDSGGYMLLPAGNTAIPGWTVPGSVTGSITWGNAALTGFAAADGSQFVELTGLGNDSPNGAIGQDIATVIGATYNVLLYFAAASDVNPDVLIDGHALTLALVPGDIDPPNWFSVGASFVAADTTTSLVIARAAPDGFALYIDHISVTLETAETPTDVPEPPGLALLAVALAATALARSRPAAIRHA